MEQTDLKILEKFSFSPDSAIGALSGVAYLGDYLYFVGDDVRYLLKTSLKNKITATTTFEKVPLLESSEQEALTVLSKAEKPDFEALSCIIFNEQLHLLVMGSGSTEKRKQALLYNPSNHQVQTLLDKLDYDYLQNSVALTGGADLNIEAVCSDNHHLYIFQRGNINHFHGVLVFDLEKIQAHKSLENALIRSFNLTLPEINGSVSGISDAYFFVDKNVIVATAAVEQTLNTYDDGVVLGSYILVLSPKEEVLDSFLIQDAEGNTLAIKVEGITWLESNADGEVFLLVTDSDGGLSEVITVLLKNSVFTKLDT
ncbi:DUF6929 family protein [Acinetobacter junii]|uniref:Phytase-like domain-containing protein n=2 Tax=Acinetobacter junii TaxID=40215 RepID=S7WNR0_ACIJU|nr:hypothetical protein [Acinetobacter junii]APU49618.1 hypothetical protein BVL33_14485 [Acinetobacter junii]EEY92831.1 hypothetical protein HMPREF0026_00107 [Acinetobacter junii SH205]ENV51727.1 hypothetical protein F953_00827 [Acinetobacter junii CIP 107470 = MTCC 11364]EPR83527.1 hypothetical protein L292_0455 [Acinetobacter junii CIP 107470 = MTCC 11364]MQZ56485.1 hypothetical protein [Acinetobacter junii]